MLKRYLPLIFVLLVVIATVFGFLALRDRERAAGTAPDAAPAATPAPDGVPEYRVETEEEYQQTLAALGTSTEEIEAWARTQGFPPGTYTSVKGEPLARNYRMERVPSLRELADGGDMWAMQVLATRIGPDAPQEAIERYREAVVLGSAYAAFKLGELHREIARWLAINHDDREEVVAIAQRENPLAYTSLAWLMIAEYEAGLPPGAISATLTSFHTPEESLARSCERAAGILEEIRAERAARGLAPDDTLPPLAIELPAEEIAGYCDPAVFPRADYSSCETIRLVGELGAVTGHRCR